MPRKKQELPDTSKSNIEDYLKDKFKDKGVDLLNVENPEEGVFRLAISVPPEMSDELRTKFAGNIKEATEIPAPVVRSVKSTPGTMIGRHREVTKEVTYLETLVRKYNAAQEKADLQRQEEATKKKIERVTASMKKAGKSKEEIEKAASDIRFRDKLTPVYLDLRRKRRVDEEEAQKLYDRSFKEYTRTGAYGSTVDILTDFCIKGFYNDVEDEQVREYFDSYVHDIKLLKFMGDVFFSLWLNGSTHIITTEGEYQPHSDGISSIPGKPPGKSSGKKLNKATAALEKYFKNKLGNKFDKSEFEGAMKEIALRRMVTESVSDIPIEFSILDPSLVDVDDSLMFEDKQRIVLKSEALEEVRSLLERQKSNDPEDKLSPRERELLKLLPSKMKKAAEDNEKYILEDETTYNIFYRKLNYQRRAKPPFSRVFDALDYKDELRKADYATLDGIVNYILLVTVGDDKCPVTDQSQLEGIADAIDTPAKAYHIIWSHAIKMEYITPQRVGEILGKEKYEPVEDDIFVAFGIPRAILDGTEVRGDGARLAVTALNAKIQAMRLLVEDWLYDIYKKVASNAGFDHYPKIRWSDETISLDSLATKNTNIMNQIAQKHVSWKTGVEKLGYNPDAELARLEDQLKHEQNGVLIPGSAFQQTMNTTTDGDGMSGRPTSQPQKKDKSPGTDTRNNDRTPSSPAPSQTDRADEQES